VSTTRQRGSHWELAAESFLRQRGLRTLARNYQARVGEIDLIMMDGDTLVFTEVRFRADETYGSGADTVTRAKQQRIIRAARNYLSRHAAVNDVHCRFDVVSIGIRQGRTLFDWIQNAFDAN
jgi:putative endonuclease